MAETDLHTAYKEARNIVHQAFLREAAVFQSCAAFAEGNGRLITYLNNMKKTLLDDEKTAQKRLRSAYAETCERLGIAPRSVSVSALEKKLKRVIPSRVLDYPGPLGFGFLEDRLGDTYDPGQILLFKNLSADQIVWQGSLTYEALNFIDGERSIVDIRNAVSAEYIPVDLEAIEQYLQLLQKAGVITM
jgi:hypothetical protein